MIRALAAAMAVVCLTLADPSVAASVPTAGVVANGAAAPSAAADPPQPSPAQPSMPQPAPKQPGTQGPGTPQSPPQSPPQPPPPPPPPSAGSPGGVTLNLPAFDYIVAFVSPTEGGVLRAEETGWFRVELRNLEQRPFKKVRIAYKALTPLEGLSPSGAAELEQIGPNERQMVNLQIMSSRSMPSGQVDYVLEVSAEGGAYGPPARITFRTRAFVAPRLEILAVDRQLLGERVLVKAQIQNLGGPARDVSARFISTEPGVTVDSTSNLPIGDLPGGQVREVSAEVALGPGGLERADVPLWLEVKERHEDLGFRERVTIPIAENETLTKSATPSSL